MARLNLPNMAYEPAERVDVYAPAVRGLMTLEPDPERQLKYADFIDIYSALDDNERKLYATNSPDEAATVSSYFPQAREEGRQEGRQKGEAAMPLRQMHRKFREVPEDVEHRMRAADAETLLVWSERILTAGHAEDVIR